MNTPDINLSKYERIASFGLSALFGLFFLNLKKSQPAKNIYGITALGFLARSITGYCPIYRILHIEGYDFLSQDKEKKFGNGTRDIVEEASWESFPASDPPSYLLREPIQIQHHIHKKTSAKK